MSARQSGVWWRAAAILILWGGPVAPAHGFAGGTGEPNDPYQIATAEQLIAIGADPNLLDKHFVLLNDIDLDPNLPGGQTFAEAVIAPDANGADLAFQGTPFAGGFDGNGHTITNLRIENAEAHYLGLFGAVAVSGAVRDLDLDNILIDGLAYTGTLAGANHGTISRCRASGRVYGVSTVGGLVGQNWGTIADSHASASARGWLYCGSVGGLVGANQISSTVENCHASGEVFASDDGGGLVGVNGGNIAKSYATGNVTGGNQSWSLGGLVGQNDSGTITYCYATGNVFTWQQGWALGGLVGYLHTGIVANCYAHGNVSGGDDCVALGGLTGDGGWGTITNCYASGSVSAEANSKNLGGLAGNHKGGEMRRCFWDVETSGLSESAGGTGLPTVQMQDNETFTSAGWDLVGERGNGTADLWLVPEAGGYPVLALLSDLYDPPQLTGSGTPDNPFRIATAEDLGAMWHHDPCACYELTGDIDLFGIVWTAAPVADFGGTFEGAGFVISNLTVGGRDHLGLFGTLAAGAVVSNLGIEDADILGEDNALFAGALAGFSNGTLVACYATGGVAAGDRSAELGGLVGLNRGVICQCHAAVHVSGETESCNIGGLAGGSLGRIRDSYATGNVFAGDDSDSLGGLLGSNRDGTLTSCYATGRVSGGQRSYVVGGLLGRSNVETAADCHFLAPIDGGGPDSGWGQPKREEQMKQQASFVGWDFDMTWMICEGRDYPHLQWENVPSPDEAESEH